MFENKTTPRIRILKDFLLTHIRLSVRYLVMFVNAFLVFFIGSMGWAHTDPSEIYVRTQAVFKHYGVPAEPDSGALLKKWSGQTNRPELEKILSFIDPFRLFFQFTRWERRDGTDVILGFQDIAAKKVLDFEVPLRPQGKSSQNFDLHLRKARTNPLSQPLQGLRIALDPGHMGGRFWDDLTGKVVKDKSGKTVSEGLIALQTALLLEKSLKELGAETYVTRRMLRPVTPVPYEDLNLPFYARKALREQSLEPWFQSLLDLAPPGQKLFSAFDSSPQVRKIFSESSRADYFILMADLEARAQGMRQFQPDITLIIHFDTHEPPGDPTGVSPIRFEKTKAYVEGSVMPAEWATRTDRQYFMRHLLEPDSWNASVQLSRTLVKQMSTRLKLEPEVETSDVSRVIEPGLMARNLYLTKEVSETALSYVECLYYNDPWEFSEFRKQDHVMKIGGLNYFYSNRLVQVVDALRDGIVSFVSSYSVSSSSANLP